MTFPVLEYADRVWRGEATLEDYHSGALRRHGVLDVAPDVGLWPAFGNVFPLRTGDGLVLFDTGAAATANAMHSAVRAWSPEPLRHAVYSHGHVDHVFGVGPFDEEAERRGLPRPVVVAHEAVPRRFARYRLTAGYNEWINRRQFGLADFHWPREYREPDTTYRSSTEITCGDLTLHLHHARGETDDHTFAHLPEHRILFCGDLFIWVAPNAGNPQKVQRYPAEWAEALRTMAGMGAELLLPGHGLPVQGAERIRTALTDAAAYLESLVEQTLALMNQGAPLEEILHSVRVPEELAAKPYLQARYDEPEFIVRNVWRLYGGWYDGDPAHLKPAPADRVAEALADLAGGSGVLAERARRAVAEGDLRLACHLAQWAARADPEDPGVQRVRAEVFAARAEAETSVMARGVYGWAAAESRSGLSGDDVLTEVHRANEGRNRWAF